MQVPRLRNILTLRNSFSPSSYPASFHSTPASLEKWKKKWNSDAGRGQQPSKTYIKYATRQKRADAKKALKNLLYKSGSSKLPFQDENSNSWNVEQEDNPHGFKKNSQSKKSSAKTTSHCSSHNGRSQYSGSKRRPRRESFCEDFDEHPETVFQATFGNRCFTWSFRSWEESHSHSSKGFEWRDESNWGKKKREEWETPSESEEDDDDKSCNVGSHSDRKILGLPSSGTLKIEDVKSAFRLSALKWHPDKHQGPSQEMAEEKFKLCVDAYKSLCSALS